MNEVCIIIKDPGGCACMKLDYIFTMILLKHFEHILHVIHTFKSQ